MTDDKFKPPTSTLLDTAHALGTGVIGSVPAIGNLLAEVFKMVVAPPLESRKKEWMETAGAALSELHQKHKCVISDLQQNPEFIDTIVQASQAAFRTSHVEKLEALRNAVMNSALPELPSEVLRKQFIELVDRFTPLHLRILKFLENPPKYRKHTDGIGFSVRSAGTLKDMVIDVYPDLESHQPEIDTIAKDLDERGLLEFSAHAFTKRASDGVPKGVTELGRQFLAFIARPSI